jgi:MFS family permease
MIRKTPNIIERNIPIYYISQFLYALVFTIPIWIVFYQQRVSVAEISFLVAISYAVQLICELPTGAFADLVGRKWSVMLGFAISVVANFLVAISTGFAELVVVAMIFGLAESLISGSLEALIYDTLKQEKKEKDFAKITAKNGVYFQIALSIGTLSGGFLYVVWNQLPYVLYMLSLTVGAFLTSFYIEPTIDSEKFSFQNYMKQIKDGAKHAFETRAAVLMSCFYIAIGSITWANNLYFYDFMMVELRFSDQLRGVLAATIRIMNILIIRFILTNESIVSRRNMIFLFPILMIIGFLPGIFFNGYAALPFVMVAVMAGTSRWIILSKYTNEMFASKYRATAISTLSMIVGVFFVIITTISGPVIEQYGVKMVYSILGVLAVTTVLPLSFILAKQISEKEQ